MTRSYDADLLRMAHLNFVDFSRHGARGGGSGAGIDERDGLLLYASGTTFPAVCNGAYRLHAALGVEEVLARADAYFGTLGRGYTLWISHVDERDFDLADAAKAAGMHALLDEPEMICTSPVGVPVAPDGIELRWISTQAEVGQFARLNGQAYAIYGMPPETVPDMLADAAATLEPHVHTVMAWRGGEPVASAQLFMSHGLAGVYWVGTAEAARGQGLGELVTATVTNLGFELGAPAVTLQASPMGEPIYARMGYQTAYRYSGWVDFGPT